MWNTYVVAKYKSLGKIAVVLIPYEFSRRFNCRTYKADNTIEVRSYGKYTIGRKSLKKDDFLTIFVISTQH